MRAAPRANARSSAQQREQERTLTRVTAEAEREEQVSRHDREATAVRQREERDAKTRQRAHEIGQELIAARCTAEDLMTDLEGACSQLAAGQATLEQVRPIQLARDAARGELELWELAAADLREDAALVGRR